MRVNRRVVLRFAESPMMIRKRNDAMPAEIRILALGTILLLVHIFAAAIVRTRQYGAEWNMGPREESLPPPSPRAGRLARAQANFQETLPLAIIALAGTVLAGRSTASMALRGGIWRGARIVYLPLYAAGVPKIRTLAFLISLAGLGLSLWPLLAH
jgi:uncharacterized MAPEG superfamily protein